MASNIDTLKLLGSLLGSGGPSRGAGATILQSVLGGGQQTQQGGGQGAGLGGLLGAVLGGAAGGNLGGVSAQQRVQQQAQSGQGGGLADLLNQTGLGGLLGAAVGQAQGEQAAPAQASARLPQGVSPAQASEQASLLIRAMINAAKSDGQFDKQEEQAILGKLGDISQDEINFIRQELQAPLDVDAFIKTIPRGMEQQVYAMSLMAINLDHKNEAVYLDKLAKGTGISPQVSNQIHTQMGAPVLYS